MGRGWQGWGWGKDKSKDIYLIMDFSRKATKARKKAFLSARKAIVLLLISLGDKSDKGEKKNCSVYTNLEFRFLKFYSYLIQFNKNLTDHSKVEEAYAEGKKQLEVVERVVKVYLAYPPKTKNIMELKLQ
uniref:Uncharacterized protein n=1 Tax=Brassica oleracea var. oleracea TaxID=109376 RepID=A0A0D3DVC0_BRAOL